MFVDTAKNTMKIIETEEGKTSDGAHYLMRMRRDSTKFFTDNLDCQPTTKNLDDAAEYISEISGLKLSNKQIQNILALNPHVRIKLAVYDGVFDTDVRDGLSGAVSKYLLGCEWPKIVDNIDIDVFLTVLHSEAKHHGFELITDNAIN